MKGQSPEKGKKRMRTRSQRKKEGILKQFEGSERSGPILQLFKWRRIILDEAPDYLKLKRVRGHILSMSSLAFLFYTFQRCLLHFPFSQAIFDGM